MSSPERDSDRRGREENVTGSTTAMVCEGEESKTSLRIVGCGFRAEASFLVGVVKVPSLRSDDVPFDPKFLARWPMA